MPVMEPSITRDSFSELIISLKGNHFRDAHVSGDFEVREIRISDHKEKLLVYQQEIEKHQLPLEFKSISERTLTVHVKGHVCIVWESKFERPSFYSIMVDRFNSIVARERMLCQERVIFDYCDIDTETNTSLEIYEKMVIGVKPERCECAVKVLTHHYEKLLDCEVREQFSSHYLGFYSTLYDKNLALKLMSEEGFDPDIRHVMIKAIYDDHLGIKQVFDEARSACEYVLIKKL